MSPKLCTIGVIWVPNSWILIFQTLNLYSISPLALASNFRILIFGSQTCMVVSSRSPNLHVNTPVHFLGPRWHCLTSLYKFGDPNIKIWELRTCDTAIKVQWLKYQNSRVRSLDDTAVPVYRPLMNFTLKSLICGSIDEIGQRKEKHLMQIPIKVKRK